MYQVCSAPNYVIEKSNLYNFDLWKVYSTNKIMNNTKSFNKKLIQHTVELLGSVEGLIQSHYTDNHILQHKCSTTQLYDDLVVRLDWLFVDITTTIKAFSQSAIDFMYIKSPLLIKHLFARYCYKYFIYQI